MRIPPVLIGRASAHDRTLVAAIVAAPWPSRWSGHITALHYYFVERHLHGYLTATQRHAGRPFWYYIPIVLGGALPWTAYLAPAAAVLAKGPPEAGAPVRAGAWRMVLWGWFGFGLVFLSIGESKLVTYALPLFPALAILIGEHVSRHGSHSSGSDPLFRFAFATHVLTLAVLPSLGLLALQWRFSAIHPYL